MNTANELISENPVVEEVHSIKWLNGVSVTVLVSLLVIILLLIDFSAVVFANTRREQALDLITPGMRITQVERTLNSAGYLTLYIESDHPFLQVSTITDPPLTARLIHRFFPSSQADSWLRDQMARGTRFYIRGDASGQVSLTPSGKVGYELVPPASWPLLM